MTSWAATPQRFDIGRVVSRTFGAIERNFPLLLMLALLFVVLPAIVFGWAQVRLFGSQLGQVPSPGGAPVMPEFTFQKGALWSVSGLTSLVFSFVLQAAVVQATVADLNGRRASFSECVATGFRYFLPLAGIAILLAIALFFGAILLIVPAIMMAMAWIVVAPAEVVERTGVLGAFSRSAALTRGYRWEIFALVLVYGVAFIVVEMVLLGIFGGLTMATLGRQTWVISVVVAPALRALSLVGLVGVASIYYELRTIKEGVAPETLASVFD